MTNTVEYFKKNGYVVLQNALTPQQCQRLVDHMFELKRQGALINDDQCPLSDAIYGDSEFDNLLVKFAEPIGINVGKKLLPTYSYARIYRPGEILKKHKDRPACEISATLTLGYDSKKIWPIYFDEEKEVAVDLDVGEMAVYQGCDVLHWRTAFKGVWHIQVFLHYVDANGPYRNHVRDGRTQYGQQKIQNVIEPNAQLKNTNTDVKPNTANTTRTREISVQKPIFDSVIIPNNDRTFPGYFCIDKNNLSELMFTKEECQQIINLVNDVYPNTASIGGTKENSKVVKNIRSANIYVLDNDKENRWIFEKVSKIVSVVNQLHFDYEIAGITHGLQLIHYASDQQYPGHYDWHVDAGHGDVSCRKISLTVQISNPQDYRGGELVINNHCNEVIGTQEQGSVHLFPSYMPHKVTPITQGERYSLVIWVHGSRRFR